jgi:ABC-type branched-subunit amino acid transport system substrate-binding protein
VANPSIPESAPSYGAVARQIIDAKPDAILVQMDPPQAGIFFSQFLTLGGGNIPVIGGDITLNADFVKAVGAQYYADHVVAIEASGKPSGPGLATFNDGFQAAYAAPPAYLCAHAYDGMTAGALAMVDAKSTDPQVYYKHVLEVTTPGADRTEVYDFKTGAKLLSEGKKIKFYGVSTSLIYNKFHRPAADFAVQKASPSGGNTFISLIPATSLAALS